MATVAADAVADLATADVADAMADVAETDLVEDVQPAKLAAETVAATVSAMVARLDLTALAKTRELATTPNP